MTSSAVITQLSSENPTIKQATTNSAPSVGGGEDQSVQNVQRSNKPRPLKLEQPMDYYPKSTTGPGFNFSHQQVQLMNSDELVDLMNRINSGVKSGQFNSQLAQLIFRLYQQLKSYGDKVEQQHKNELNRVFVSLRQACCRDSGQLGTPCRLKIMELVELRAMGWRPNLAHSQYYLNRSANNAETIGGVHYVQQVPMQQPVQHTQQQAIPQMEFDQSIMAPPISAPPFGSVPVNPFAFVPPPQHHQPMVSHHVTHAAEIAPPTFAQPAVSQTAPSYYLIPASGAIFPHPAPPMAMMPPPSPIGAPPMGFTMPPPAQQTVQQPISNQYPPISVAQNLMTTSGGMEQQQASPPEPETPWPRGAVVKASAKPALPQKVPGKNMFRDEIIIRNADSGKIMGVKGRRVAVVEEISKTIISFQKVPQGAKERTLTITGNCEDTIEKAKLLIEETIRRNVSPSRPEGATEDENEIQENLDPMPETVPEFMPAESKGHIELADVQNLMTNGNQDVNSNFFELSSDSGVLKLSCADPEMLAAAQDALNAYFKRMTPLRRSHGAQGLSQSERQLRAERRKSMPSFSPDSTGQKRRQSPTHTGQTCPPDEVLSWRRRDPPQQTEDMIKNGDRGSSNSPKAQPQNQKNRRDSAGNRSFHRKNQQHGFAKSTPNLAIEKEDQEEDSENNDGPEAKSQLQMRVLYTRDYLLQCSASPLAHISPGAVPKIQSEAPEILREVPGKFDGADYKERNDGLKAAIRQ